MILAKLLAILSFLLTTSLCALQYYSEYQEIYTTKKGLTFQATVWPQEKNSFVGRMSCNGCNPQEGDVPCTTKLPVTCIVNYMKLDRPYYSFYAASSLQTKAGQSATPFANADQSFYEGWTGGVIALAEPIRGLEIDSYFTGTKICQNTFGQEAKFATFTDGLYMKQMNGPVLKLQKSWDWKQTQRGEFNFWGVFNHNYKGRSWVWTQNTPTGNCMLPRTNPLPLKRF